MSKIRDKYSNFRIIEVGISVNGFEFYHEFIIPINFNMRRFSEKKGAMVDITLEDWLASDFVHILAYKLSALHDPCSLSLIGCRTLSAASCPRAPLAKGTSFVESWTNPFINLIASYFVNNFFKDVAKF